MRRIFSILAIFVIVFIVFPVTGTEASTYSIKPLDGLVISGIPPDSFNLNNPNMLIGLCKVDDPVSLSDYEVFAIGKNIPLYSYVNLFTYSLSSLNSSDINNLKSYYGKIPDDDFQDMDMARSAVLYGTRENGKLLSYVEKKEPDIQITYKTISTRLGPSVIPERHVVPNNDFVTYFLLNPYAAPQNLRENPFQVANTYYIQPALYNTLSSRIKYNDQYLDFSGFYVDVPDKTASQGYYNIVESSLDKFYAFVHSKGKNLIVENLNNSTLPLGIYGDIIGIKVEGTSFDILRNARIKFPDKVIYASFDGDFTSSKNIENFLNECILYGIYPEFNRNTATGDFLYYETYFQQNSQIIEKAVNEISLLNQAKFTNEFSVNGTRISQFGRYPFEFFVVSYDGNLQFGLSQELFNNKSDFTIMDPSNNPVNFSIQDNSVKIDTYIDGIKVLRVVPYGFTSVYLGTYPLNSSTAGFNSYFVNAGNKSGILNANFNIKNAQRSATMELQPLGIQYFYNSSIPTSISVGSESYQVPQQTSKANLQILWLLLILGLCILLFFSKKLIVKKGISFNLFVLLVTVLPLALIILNGVFIHYTAITVIFFTFSLLLIITAFYEKGYFRIILFSGVLLFFLGMLYNYLELSTLMPQPFSGLVPFKLYENFLFYFPFIFVTLFFQFIKGKNIIKLQVIFIIITLGLILIFFDNSSLPFQFELSWRSLYPLFALFGGNMLLQILNRPARINRILLSIIPIIIAVISVPLSKYAFSTNIFQPQFIDFSLLLRQVLLFSIPFFFISAYLYANERAVKGATFSYFVMTMLSILVLYNFLSQYALKNGNQVVSGLSYIVNPILIALMLVSLIESPKESF